MADLLLEIGTEELPASAIYDALAQIESMMPSLLARAHLSFDETWTLATPRRLAVTVRGVGDRAGAQVSRKKGPPLSAARNDDGSWTQAAAGFAKSQGIEVDDLRVEETGKGSYVIAVTETEGDEVEDILPGLLYELITSLHFKKSMRWGSSEERFSRPVRWLVAILEDKVIPFEYSGLTSSNISFGHRYLSTGEIRIPAPRSYEHALREAFVVADHRDRLTEIIRASEHLCEEAGAVPVLDDEVLEEVVQLVEWPGVVLGSFDERYLRLPGEIVVHAMESHQRYFPVETPDGALCACFLAVHNGDPDRADIIIRGHERVLAARLADAEFFFDEDLKRPLADRLEDLEHVVYQSELGSMAEKSARLASLVAGECAQLGEDGELSERACRAALLAKCDLVTHMVIEFPALQGTVGSIYAAKGGEDARVAKAVGEQYLPRRLGDALPETTEGALLSIAEKADNLAASFGLGHVPTGSEDPYALRRQAVGLLLILLEHGFAFRVSDLVSASAADLEGEAHGFAWTAEAGSAFTDFFMSRERVFFTERGYRYDLVEAALALDWDVPLSSQRRLDALVQAREEGLLARLYTAFERCHNLARGQETGEVLGALLAEPIEQELLDTLVHIEAQVESALDVLDFDGALAALEPLCEPVDRLFDQVLIMAEDESVRKNRLSLLARIDALFNRVADFSRLTWD
jgi:glycyl-tRNA synthetase beta chain